MDEITAEQWMAFASKYVLKAASLSEQVEGLQRELELADECIQTLKAEAKKKEANDGD